MEAGGEPAPARVLQVGGLRLDLDRHVITRDEHEIELTPSEFDLLKVFMEYPGHAFTRSELIEKGLGYAYDGLDRGVDSHIKNLVGGNKNTRITSSGLAHVQNIEGYSGGDELNTRAQAT